MFVFYQCASLITYILVGGCLEVHLATFLYLLTMVAFTLVLSILIVLSGFRIFLVVKVQFFFAEPRCPLGPVNTLCLVYLVYLN